MASGWKSLLILRLLKGERVSPAVPPLAEASPASTCRYNKSPMQLMIRWCLQHDILCVTKSLTEKNIILQGDVFDFEITKEDMAVLVRRGSVYVWCVVIIIVCNSRTQSTKITEAVGTHWEFYGGKK